MFGFNDGVHLNYAGSYYGPDSFETFRSFRVVVLSLSLLGAGVLACLSMSVDDEAKRLIMRGIAGYVLMAGLNGFCSYINQNTLRFRQYSRAIVLERTTFLLAVLILVGAGARDYWWYVYGSVLAAFILLAYNISSSKELFWGPRTPLRALSSKIWKNFSGGFALMIAIILNQSMIIIGRLVIEGSFGIRAFGGYSFALSVLNVAGLVMNSASQVTFPLVKRTAESEVPRVSRLLDLYASVLGALLLLVYFPVWALVDIAYVPYRALLSYLMFLFPLVIFQGKFQLVVVNGFKIAGRMSSFLVVSVVGVCIEGIVCVAAAFLFHTVPSVVIASVVGYVGQYYLAVSVLRGKAGRGLSLENLLDLVIAAAFVLICLVPARALGLAGWYGLAVSFGGYVALMLLVGYVQRRRLAWGFRQLRMFLSH